LDAFEAHHLSNHAGKRPQSNNFCLLICV
jgi:hypothetical protein